MIKSRVILHSVVRLKH